MSSKLTVGELAEAARVPVSTIRYYERTGLLRPSARSASNYRLYSNEDLERLRFVRSAQATGFTLKDIQALLRPAACGAVQHLIGERLAEVAERLKELRRVQKMLREALKECHAHETTGRCKVVDELSASARFQPSHSK